MSALLATANPSPSREGRGLIRPAGPTWTSPVLRDLLAGPRLSDREQRALVREAQDGAAAQTMAELNLATEEEQRERLHRRRDRGLRARRRLLEAALGMVVEVARGHRDTEAGESLLHVGLAHVAAAIGRYEPDQEPAAFLDWVTGQVSAAVAARGVAAGSADGGGGAEIVAAVRARAALIGSPLSDQEVEVLSLRFGDDHRRGLSLTDAGKALGLTRYDVRRVEARAIARLRRHPSTQGTSR